jgi:uncharacterized protein
MNRNLLTRAIVVGDEAGRLEEVENLIKRNPPDSEINKFLNDASRTSRSSRRALPLTSIRSSNDSGERISGTAAVYNTASQDLGSFIEYLRPSCFENSLKENDIFCCYNHNSEFILGRLSNRTLTLDDRHDGLHFSCELPRTSYARDVYEVIRRGDVTGMSFRFYVTKDRWSDLGRVQKREVIEAELYEISPVIEPAYTQSSVNARKLLEKYCGWNCYSDDLDIRRRRLRLQELETSHLESNDVVNDDLSIRKRRLQLLSKM